ncbi:MAG TPA: hypothetical protein VMP01_16675 [Pirellulaceae bacterium]|nr:hypothetical protein [Pirellulaceae bacterium]
MKLALLGCDDEALALLTSAVLDGIHTLVAAYDAAGFVPRLRALVPRARFDDDWESLLVASGIDAVIVARGRFDPSAESGFSADERRVDQLRKLAQAAVPMLVIHPACEMIVGYELEMIRADSGGVMQPYVPGLAHPVVAEIEALAAGDSSPLGEIEQITLERQLSDRSRAAVLTQFARDASLLRRLVGTIRQVSASGPAGSEYQDPLAARTRIPPSLANLSVHISGGRPFSARWSVGPIDDLAGGKLTLIGSRGRAMLRMPSGVNRPWELEVAGTEQRLAYEPFDEGEQALAALQQAVEQGREHTSTWIDVCRDLEAAAAIDRSLEKGRAIALYADEISEEQSFKGVMAVAGCLVLAATLAGLLLVVMVEALQLEVRRAPLWRAWPVILVTPIIVFLLLQSLKSVARKPKERPTPVVDSAIGS